MKVLQICNKPPQPQVDGGCIAINTLSNGLLEKGVLLKILTVATEKHPYLESEIDAEFAKKTKLEAVHLDTRINVIDAFSALVTADAYNVSRFFSTDFDKRLRELLTSDSYDIVHLESLFTTPYIDTIRRFSTAKIVLRSHNLEHLIWQRLANSTGNKAKKIYLRHLASRLKTYEEKTVKQVDGIAAISFDDTNRFRQIPEAAPVVTIPFGIKLEKYIPANKAVGKTVQFCHIGAMNWEPNKEAVSWLLDEIWPLLKNEDAELHLAGRKMPAYISDFADDKLIVHGDVENALDFMNQQDVMVVPLLSGGGMRIKIMEAMALGKAVITTKLGAEGIDCKNNENILIADSSEDIAGLMKSLSQDKEKISRIGTNARKLVEKNYRHAKIMDDLIAFYQRMLDQPKG